MDIVKAYGSWVQKLSAGGHPIAARRLLALGWRAQGLRYRVAGDRRLLPADRFLAAFMMRAMIRPLADPNNSAIVSIFTPCELVQEAGLNPYNVEGFSSYLSGSQAERLFMQTAEDAGLSETLCSFHKAFLGAAVSGVLPAPRCIVYTSLACDANLVTFRWLADFYQVPLYAIDVPLRNTDADIFYLADQLREVASFLESHTGRRIDEAALRTRLERSRATLADYDAFQRIRARKAVATDLVTPLYAGMTNNVLLGTEDERRYAAMLVRDAQAAAPMDPDQVSIYWMHTIPFWSESVQNALAFNDRARIVGCELGQSFPIDFDPSDPYRAMAWRLANHALNGDASRRIAYGIQHAREAGADGAVWFCHWGCKHTLGAAQLAKRAFEDAGLPLLVLDGDSIDHAHGGEGQTATRLGAFLEMLEERRAAAPHAAAPTEKAV